MTEETHLLSSSKDKNFLSHSQSINQDKTSLEATTWPVMKSFQVELLTLLADNLEFMESMNSPSNTTNKSMQNTLRLGRLNTQDLEIPRLSRSPLTMDLVMKLIHLAMFSNSSQISQRETSSSMLTTTRRSWDTLLDLTLGSLKTLIESSS